MEIISVKQCSRCKEDKLATSEFFLKRARNKDGFTGFCRLCHNRATKSWRKQHRFVKHGVDKRLLLQRQNWLCANPGCRIPLTAETGVVDHDHQCCPNRFSCGKCIRGVLCRTCNTSLGFAQDSSEILRGLAAYIDFTKLKG